MFQPTAGFWHPGKFDYFDCHAELRGINDRLRLGAVWPDEWHSSLLTSSSRLATPAALSTSLDWRAAMSADGPDDEDVYRGTSDDDRIEFETWDGKIYGRNGNDRIHAGAGEATVYGGKGDDKLWGGGDDDVLKGGSGNDRLHGDGSGAKGDDILRGGKGDDFLSGQRGRDVLVGGLGADTLKGGSSADHFVFAAAAESPVGDGDTIIGFKSGIDTLDLTALLSLQDLWFHDGPGFREHAGEVIYRDGVLRADVDGDGFADLEITIEGSVEISLGDLDPKRYVQDAGEIQYGTDGDDQIEVWGGPNITVYGLRGDDWLSNQYMNCVLVGGAGNDVMWGGGNDDLLKGGSGDDQLFGDYWDGSGYLGKDILRGGKGDDVLVGQLDQDMLIGGPGDDTFVYSPDFDRATEEYYYLADTIARGNGAAAMEGVGAPGGDLIDISGLGPSGLYDSAPFVIDGTRDLGRLWLADEGSTTVVYAHIHNDPEAKLFVIKDGAAVSAADYTADDFIL